MDKESLEEITSWLDDEEISYILIIQDDKGIRYRHRSLYGIEGLQQMIGLITENHPDAAETIALGSISTLVGIESEQLHPQLSETAETFREAVEDGSGIEFEDPGILN